MLLARTAFPGTHLVGPGSVLNLLPLPLGALPKCLPTVQLLKGFFNGPLASGFFFCSLKCS